MMKGKSPKEFAQMQVYGSGQKGQQHSQVNKQSQVSHSQHRLDNSQKFETSHFNVQHVPHDQVVPSKYTVMSQALMEKVLDNSHIKKIFERLHLQSGQKVAGDGKMLFSEDEMNNYDEEVKRSGKKENQTQKQTPKEKDIIDRLYYDKSSQQEKEELRRRREEQIKSECTFSPRVEKSSVFNSSGNQDSIFLQKREPTFFQQSQKMQAAYDMHKEILRDAKQNEQQQEFQVKPKLSKKTQIIGEQAFHKRGIQNLIVFDRLYQDQKECEVPLDTFSYKPYVSHRPCSQPRTMKIDDYLYQDAKRRILNLNIFNKKEKKESMNHIQSSADKTHSQSQSRYNWKVVFSKFDKDFQEAVGRMAFEKNPNRMSMPETVSWLEVIDILQLLHFLNSTTQDDKSKISSIVQRIWNQLSSHTDRQRILVRNLEVFLFAVQNIRADGDMIPFISEQPVDEKTTFSLNISQEKVSSDNKANSLLNTPKLSQVDQNTRHPIGQFDLHDNLYYNDHQVALIHSIFKDLYDSKLTSHRIQRARTTHVEASKNSYAPEISETSRKLAHEKRLIL